MTHVKFLKMKLYGFIHEMTNNLQNQITKRKWKKTSKASYLRRNDQGYKAVWRGRFKWEMNLKFILNLINKANKVYGQNLIVVWTTG